MQNVRLLFVHSDNSAPAPPATCPWPGLGFRGKLSAQSQRRPRSHNFFPVLVQEDRIWSVGIPMFGFPRIGDPKLAP